MSLIEDSLSEHFHLVYTQFRVTKVVFVFCFVKGRVRFSPVSDKEGDNKESHHSD